MSLIGYDGQIELDEDDWLYEDESQRDPDEEDGWECEFGADCLMPSVLHRRSECYTREMAQAWQQEAEEVHETMKNTAIIKLWVFHAEDKEIIWTAENWYGPMPDGDDIDPLLLQREDGLSPDAHQLLKLESNWNAEDGRHCIYGRVPVARDGWFYKALSKWGLEKMKESGFLIPKEAR